MCVETDGVCGSHLFFLDYCRKLLTVMFLIMLLSPEFKVFWSCLTTPPNTFCFGKSKQTTCSFLNAPGSGSPLCFGTYFYFLPKTFPYPQIFFTQVTPSLSVSVQLSHKLFQDVFCEPHSHCLQ